MSRIVILDYGVGNLRSVQKALEKVGAEAVISSDHDVIASATKLILPGVGAFGDAIIRLRETKVVDLIHAHIDSGKPFLGICLGLQLLFTRSHENGIHAGLDIFPGEIVEFPTIPKLKVPHMGWNQLHFPKPCPLFEGLKEGDAVYFVHSFFAKPLDSSLIAAEADYPTPFAAAVWRENVYATQFHPEKSQQVGLRILENFAKLT
jgi:imidazole glycerol-phosphate synthase subunit HisH